MKIYDILKEQEVGAFWITNHYNKRYFTGFSGSTSEVIVTQDKIIFITDGRYKTQIKTEITSPEIETIIIESNMGYGKAVEDVLSQYDRIAFETSAMTVNQFQTMSKKFADKEIVEFNNVVEKLRECKSEDEIQIIKEAVAITDAAYTYVKENAKVGMTELEVKLLAENYHILHGAEAQSFSAIVAAGANGALPHASATDYVIQDGDMVTLDFGCQYKGYCSDMTRSFVMGGEPTEPEIIKIHDIITKTMLMQIDAVKAGVKCKDVDKVGRDYITEMGYGDKFIHGTGHGVGLEVHEAPTVSFMSEQVLEEGMIITIEPGIYVEGLGGIRVEQDLVVRKDGCEVLNQSAITWDIN